MLSLARLSSSSFRLGRGFCQKSNLSSLSNTPWKPAPLAIRSFHFSSLQKDKDDVEKERTKLKEQKSSEAEKSSKLWPFRVTMSEEQKRNKEKKIQEMKDEEEPKTMFAKVKYYLKRYWYIAVPAHMVCCTSYFVTFYALVHCGVDVISILEMLHIPDLLIDKIRNAPPSASVFVVAFILYKIATPLRYATTLLLIQGTFWTLRRLGKLKTVREVEYKMRTEYEMNKKLHGRKVYRYRNLGVRDIWRKNSQGSVAKRRAEEKSKKD